MIKMQVIGHLGKDALVNNVNGRSVINFSVAHTEKYNDASGSPIEKTIWVECAYWTEKTAVAPYLRKGTQVHVDGGPDVRTYTTNDGRNGATLSCKVTNIQLLGSRVEGPSGTPPSDSGTSNYNAPSSMPSQVTNSAPVAPAVGQDNAIDDLPF